MLTREQARKFIDKALSFSTFPECDLRIDQPGSGIDPLRAQRRHHIRLYDRAVDDDLVGAGRAVRSRRRSPSSTTSLCGRPSSAPNNSRCFHRLTRNACEPVGPQKYPELENFRGVARRRRAIEALIPHIRGIIEAAKAKDLVAAGFFERSARSRRHCQQAGQFRLRPHDRHAAFPPRSARTDGSSSGWASQPARAH